MRILLSAVAFYLVFSASVKADDLQEVSTLLKEKIEFVFNVLKNKSITQQVRDEQILEAISPSFDFQVMAKVSLSKHWKALNKAQRNEFTQAFIKQTRNSFIEKLNLFTDEKVEFQQAKKVKKRIHVLTLLISQDDQIEMLYKFYKSRQGWKIYDLAISGVSVVQSYRSQFNVIMKRGGYQELLTKLTTTNDIKIDTTN